MTLAIAAAGPSAYWYLSRATGVVTLVLLTASVVLGIVGTLRVAAPRWPRFAIDTVHRDVSLLVMVLLVVHIITSVLDSFAPIALSDAVIPVGGAYRPLWLGLGALSFDLMIAVVITSLARRRVGFRTWQAVHWLSYLSWPVAVLHGLGTGTDTKTWWSLALTVACVTAVLVAVWARLSRDASVSDAVRTPAAVLTAVTPLALAGFTLVGPLQPGWARRAGTPASLLGHKQQPVARPATVVAAGTLKAPWNAQLSGTVRQETAAGGSIVNLMMTVSGGARGKLRVRIGGTPDAASGGLSMTGSQVDLVAAGLRSAMEGKIQSLQGQQFVARLTGASVPALTLQVNLNINSQAQTVTGSVAATPAGSGSG
jgi:DMSO/TMAO reductase YedYZ heme-binding membrane subunit